VRIRLDDATDKRKEDFLAARVSWIGEDAEFSPKIFKRAKAGTNSFLK